MWSPPGDVPRRTTGFVSAKPQPLGGHSEEGEVQCPSVLAEDGLSRNPKSANDMATSSSPRWEPLSHS